MNELIDRLVGELRKQHGGELDLENENYWLFTKDGVFTFYIDHDEKELKVNVQLLDEGQAKVYFSDMEIDLLEGSD